MSVKVTHNAGFFSCCSLKLDHIVGYINKNKTMPLVVDSSSQFSWYKNAETKDKDITLEYFEHYDNIQDVSINYPIGFSQSQQFSDYSKLDYKNTTPLIKKYFSTSTQINDIIKNMEQKYNLDYDNICVLFYRGNDKNRETKICGYDEYIKYANIVLSENPQIKFLIQSDETEFIKKLRETFPENSFIFDDEIRHMEKRDDTVDKVFKDTNFVFSKYYLGITIIMSKCKYIICGSGNCSIWIMLYRGNCDNVYQHFNDRVIIHDNPINRQEREKHWVTIANEGETVNNVDLGALIRYGAHNRGWIEKTNNSTSFIANNTHFGEDPAPNIKKVLQVFKNKLA